MITVANAPVSYGVFDLARPELVPLPGGGELLDAVAAADRKSTRLNSSHP